MTKPTFEDTCRDYFNHKAQCLERVRSNKYVIRIGYHSRILIADDTADLFEKFFQEMKQLKRKGELPSDLQDVQQIVQQEVEGD